MTESNQISKTLLEIFGVEYSRLLKLNSGISFAEFKEGILETRWEFEFHIHDPENAGVLLGNVSTGAVLEPGFYGDLDEFLRKRGILKEWNHLSPLVDVVVGDKSALVLYADDADGDDKRLELLVDDFEYFMSFSA